MRSSSGEDAGVNRLAGKAMPSDWCGAVSVVSLAPGIQRGLQRLDARKRGMDVEQLALQGLVQPLNLARRSQGMDLRTAADLGCRQIPSDTKTFF